MRPEVPVGIELFPLDLVADGLPVAPCAHCTWWWAETVHDLGGREVLREWHQGSCPEYRSWSLPLSRDDRLATAWAELAGGGLDAVPAAASGVPRRHAAADRSGSALSLGDVLTAIDDADPFDDLSGRSVWEDPDRLAAQIWKALAEPLQLVFYFRYTCPVQSPTLALASSAGLSPEVEAGLQVIVKGAPVCGSVAKREALEVHSSVDRSTDPDMDPIKVLGVRSYASFPLLRDGGLIGTFAVGSATRSTFTDHQILVLRSLTELLSQATGDPWAAA